MLGSTQTRHAATRRITLATALFLTTTALVSLTPLSAVAQTGAASTSAQSFAISARPLGEALLLFSHQTHLQITSQGPMLTGRRSTAVSGHFTPSEALTRLLSGTGLTFRSEAGGAIQIVPASANITLGPVRVGGTLAHQDPTGPGVGYVAETTMAGTKTNTPITEIPNSIYVITKQQMVDQQPQNVMEALRYTPGIYSEAFGGSSNGSSGGIQGNIFQRGFKAWQFVDGLMTHSASAGETTFLERIEAVNGPASVMYGQVTPGGMIGMSLKKPTETPLHQVSVGFGNWGRYEATVDLSDKITRSGNLRYRVAAIGVTQGTQVDHVNYHRVGILPSITWDIDQKTSLSLLGMYMYTPGDGTSATGYPVNGTLFTNGTSRIPRRTFLGEPNWNQSGETDAMFEYQFKHEFNKYINFSQTFRWETTRYDQKNAYYDGNVSPELVGLSSWQNQITANQEALDTRLSGVVNTGPFQHTWVVGNDLRYYSYRDNTIFDNGSSPTLNVYNPQYQYEPCYSITSERCNVFSYSPNSSYFQEGVYFQDQIKWRNISVILGGRQDWASQSSSTVSTKNTYGTIKHGGTSSSQNDKAFTWRAGITYNTNFGLHPYFSYSTSFIPQTGSTNYLGQPFSPLTGKQLEAGVKYKIPNKDIMLTASAFRIDEDHYLISDLVHTGHSEDAGRVRSQGFELSANANLTRNLRLVASYTYEDVRFAKTTTGKKKFDLDSDSTYGAKVNETGMFVPYIPRNMVNAFADYTFKGRIFFGFGINGGIRYMGFTYSDAVNSYKVPSYLLLDLGAHYDLGSAIHALKGLKAQLAISNLTNKYYTSSCNQNLCYLGQGRRVYGNLTYNW